MFHSHSDVEEEKTRSKFTSNASSTSSLSIKPSQLDSIIVQKSLPAMQIEFQKKLQQQQQQQQQEQQLKQKKTGGNSGKPDASFYKKYIQVKEMAKLFYELSELHLTNQDNQDKALSLWKLEDIMRSPSFHGVISRREAEKTLEKNGAENCYLTRYDEEKKSCCLTVKTKRNKFKHFIINIAGGQTESAQYELKGADKFFNRFSDLLQFYENNPVNFEVYQIGDAVQSEEYAQSESEAVQTKEEQSAFGFPTWRLKHIMLSPSFHRKMLREDAELKLKNHGSPTCYLTRYDATADRFYLSVKRKIKEGKEMCYYHFVLKISKKIVPPDEMNMNKNLEPAYELEGAQMKFDTISELLAVYKAIPINFEVGTIGDEVQSDFNIMPGDPLHPREADSEIREMRSKMQHLNTEIVQLNAALVKSNAESDLIRKKNEDLNATPMLQRNDPDRVAAEFSDKMQTMEAIYKKKLEEAELERSRDLQQWESREKSLLRQLEDLQQMKGAKSNCDDRMSTGREEIMPSSSTDQDNDLKTSGMQMDGRRSQITSAQPTAQLKGIMQHPSYHGATTGAIAESKLKEHGGNCYLTRYSTSREQYSLSVARNGEYAHFDLIITSGSGDSNIYEIDGTKMQSKDIFSLLTYYKSNPLTHSIDGIGDPLRSDPSKPLERQNPEVLESIKKVYRNYSGESVDKDYSPNNNLSHPSLSNLTLITYNNIVLGTRASISIIAQLDSRWHDLGLLLGQPAEELVRYKVLTLGDTSKYPCCQRVFFEWLKDPDRSNYPATWAGVYKLLRDMEHVALATKLQVALRSNGIKI